MEVDDCINTVSFQKSTRYKWDMNFDEKWRWDMQDSLFSQEILSEWQNDLVSGTDKNAEHGTLASLVHVPDFRAAMLQLILLVWLS